MEILQGSDVATLRRLNSRTILAELYRDASAKTVAALAKAARLSRPTVEAALADLMAQGWIREQAPEGRRAKAGRPAKRYFFDARRKLIAAVDLGPHGVVAQVANLRGEVLAYIARDQLDLGDGQDALAAVEQLISDILGTVQGVEDDLLSITVGVPAVLGPDGEIVRTVVVPNWQQCSLTDRVRARYPSAEVFFENDAKLATIAESEWGLAIGCDNVVNVLIGHRLAASVIVNGELARGAHGAAGEIGALPLVGWDSAFGLLEQDASLSSQLAMAAGGDERAATVVHSFVQQLAAGIAALCLAIDPEIVILGGGIASVGRPLLEPLEQTLAPLLLFPPTIQLSTLGKSAVAGGAIANCLRYLRVELLHIG